VVAVFWTVARMEPPGPAFGRPDDKLRDIRDGLTRISLRSIRATRLKNLRVDKLDKQYCTT
jgi:hypothetical protein